MTTTDQVAQRLYQALSNHSDQYPPVDRETLKQAQAILQRLAVEEQARETQPSPVAGRIFEYRKTGMRAVVRDDGRAYWLNTGAPIYSKITAEDWVECGVHNRTRVRFVVDGGN